MPDIIVRPEAKPTWVGDLCNVHLCDVDQPVPVAPRPAKAPTRVLSVFERLADEDEPTATPVIHEAVAKVVLHPSDTDLLAAEAATLSMLYPPDQPDEKFLRYLPRFLGTTMVGGRRANVLALVKEHVTLQQVRTAYPKGLDWRDVAWMWKRMLVGLGFVHRQGFVHGAVLPPHVLVHPTGHGARIIDWTCSTTVGGKIPVRFDVWKDLYPPNLLATPATDTYMAAKCVQYLLSDNVPDRIVHLLDACLLPSPDRRMSDAWEIHDALDGALEALIGPPVYRPLAMPRSTV